MNPTDERHEPSEAAYQRHAYAGLAALYDPQNWALAQRTAGSPLPTDGKRVVYLMDGIRP